MIISLEPELLARLARRDEPYTAGLEDLDKDLAAAVRRTAFMRRLFYAAVLLVALYGTATGAVAAFGLPWWISIGGIFALELGGVTFLSHADVRRRLGEPATIPRLLGAVIAGAAGTFNLVTHTDRLLGGFFALMSVLGFASWWLDVENKRRDRLRARGQLASPAPAYQIWSHWIRHPMITAQARNFAKVHPELGVYGSLEAAVTLRQRERRDAALADALRRRISTSVGTRMAQIAILTYDMDEVARRLRTTADYDGLTALLGSELTADHVLQGRDDQAAVAARAWLTRHRSIRQPTPIADQPDTAAADSHCQPSAPQPPAETSADTDDGPTSHPCQRVRISVLGEPAIHDTDGGRVRGVRAKSLELLVFLAVHRAGAALDDIRDAVWPDIPAHRATQRLSTCLSNLRGVIRAALETIDLDDGQAGTARPDPIVNTGGRYHLDPAIVSVDWWQLLDQHRSDSTPVADEEINAAAALIADGHDYPWLDSTPMYGSDDQSEGAH